MYMFQSPLSVGSLFIAYTFHNAGAFGRTGDLEVVNNTCQSIVLITNEMHNYYNQFYSTVFCLLYMFRTNLFVHQHKHKIMYCITHFGTIVL